MGSHRLRPMVRTRGGSLQRQGFERISLSRRLRQLLHRPSSGNQNQNSMNNNIDSEIIACAEVIRAAVNHETEVTVYRRVTISRIHAEPKFDFVIYWGDVLNVSKWEWECAQADTLKEAQAKALAQITAHGDERARQLSKLKECAAKLGLQVVEAPK